MFDIEDTLTTFSHQEKSLIEILGQLRNLNKEIQKEVEDFPNDLYKFAITITNLNKELYGGIYV